MTEMIHVSARSQRSWTSLLASIFGVDPYSTNVIGGPSRTSMYATPLHEVRAGLCNGLATARSQLEAIKAGFMEELDDAVLPEGPTTKTGAPSLDGIHPEILRKCGSLLSAAHYAEAAEKSFKTVRDRLRDLTGHEKGSEAFGKGRLHVRGAAANVEEDFNDAVKFLTMAIDMLRMRRAILRMQRSKFLFEVFTI